MASRSYTLNFMGDTMLGRLIDQMFPTHVHEASEAKIARSLTSSNPALSSYGPTTPWGNALPLLHEADFSILNLETSATTHPNKWPDKVFNYRMHPANIAALTAAKVSYAGLANNHTLDFCEPGLLETVQTVKGSGIAFAGAGETKDEATRPAVLRIPNPEDGSDTSEINIWAGSDHPKEWARVSTFHFIDYSQRTRDRLKQLLTKPSQSSAALKIFSVHWGPNYAWQPAPEIRDLAHFLIDSCGIDIVHGHSSHHVQGVEKYKDKLIIYGCGDFVDDYARVPGFRNDLGGVWRVTVEETSLGERLKLKKLEMYPTKIDRFQARRLGDSEEDSQWVRRKIKDLSKQLGTDLDMEDGGEGRLILDLS